MDLTPVVDMKSRTQAEARHLPPKITLVGTPMLIAIATLLLPDFEITPDGEPVQLLSMEAYGTAFLRSFLEEVDPPTGHFFLITVPEHDLQHYAQAHGIEVHAEEHDAVRTMIDRIAAHQPQTYFSLLRSAQRLQKTSAYLRKEDGHGE